MLFTLGGNLGGAADPRGRIDNGWIDRIAR